MTKHISIDAIRHGREAAAAYSDEALAELAEQIEPEEAMTEPRVEAGDRALETARKIRQSILCEECKTRGIPGTAKFNWPLCDICIHHDIAAIAALIQSAMNAQEREPESLWLWPIEEIKSAMRQFQAAHPGKMPSEVEAEG